LRGGLLIPQGKRRLIRNIGISGGRGREHVTTISKAWGEDRYEIGGIGKKKNPESPGIEKGIHNHSRIGNAGGSQEKEKEQNIYNMQWCGV